MNNEQVHVMSVFYINLRYFCTKAVVAAAGVPHSQEGIIHC